MFSTSDKYVKALHSRLDEIENFISLVEIQKKAYRNLSSIELSDFPDLSFYKSKMELMFNSPIQYNAIIISLYACFEHFIDEIATLYLEETFKEVGKYEELPKRLQKKHIDNVADFLSNPQRYKGFSMKQEDVIENIYSCMKGSPVAKLNMPLILKHAGNLGIDQLKDLLLDIGIEQPVENVRHDEHFIQEVLSKNDSYNVEYVKSNGKIEIIFEQLNSLIEQRNKVSHSWVVDERISFDKIKNEMLPFLRAFCDVISYLVLSSYAKIVYEKEKILPFDEAIKIIDSRILCINSKSSALSVGDYILAKNEERMYITKIESLEIDNARVEKVDTSNTNIGIRLDRNITESCSFYYFT